MLHGRDGELYHLSPDRGYSVREVVQTICAALETDFAKATRDVEERLGQDAAYVIDSAKARDAFGWRPQIALTDGIGRVVGWVNEAWGEILERPLTYVHRE
jgi:dTDP-glucose 4,6-dehydratase